MFSILVAIATASTLPFQFEMSPGEGVPLFSATTAINAPLHAEPKSTSQEFARCVLQPGQALPFSMSMQVVSEPVALIVPAEKTISVTSWGRTVMLTRGAYYDSGVEKDITLQAGEIVEYLMNRAEGACMFRRDGEVIQAMCSDLPSPRSAPPQGWWIQAACGDAGGWLNLDLLRGSLDEERQF